MAKKSPILKNRKNPHLFLPIHCAACKNKFAALFSNVLQPLLVCTQRIVIEHRQHTTHDHDSDYEESVPQFMLFRNSLLKILQKKQREKYPQFDAMRTYLEFVDMMKTFSHFECNIRVFSALGSVTDK